MQARECLPIHVPLEGYLGHLEDTCQTTFPASSKQQEMWFAGCLPIDEELSDSVSSSCNQQEVSCKSGQVGISHIETQGYSQLHKATVA